MMLYPPRDAIHFLIINLIMLIKSLTNLIKSGYAEVKLNYALKIKMRNLPMVFAEQRYKNTCT
jgi:hypothetical protein